MAAGGVRGNAGTTHSDFFRMRGFIKNGTQKMDIKESLSLVQNVIFIIKHSSTSYDNLHRANYKPQSYFELNTLSLQKIPININFYLSPSSDILDSTMALNTKTILFIGASTGVGLFALKQTLAAGHQCIALCRVASKLTAIFPLETTPNLQVIEGNAHDIAAVSKALVTKSGNLVDEVVSTIGAGFNSSLGMDQPTVCGTGMETLLEALKQLRKSGLVGSPHIVVCGTKGMSRFGRDIPILMIPVYWLFVSAPIKDKKVMEALLIDSGESYTIVHPSHLNNGETTYEIRIGIEDPLKGLESSAIGYSISREDAGKWIADNLVLQLPVNYVNKIVGITN
jgi:hypothetical protein